MFLPTTTTALCAGSSWPVGKAGRILAWARRGISEAGHAMNRASPRHFHGLGGELVAVMCFSPSHHHNIPLQSVSPKAQSYLPQGTGSEKRCRAETNYQPKLWVDWFRDMRNMRSLALIEDNLRATKNYKSMRTLNTWFSPQGIGLSPPRHSDSEKKCRGATNSQAKPWGDCLWDMRNKKIIRGHWPEACKIWS